MRAIALTRARVRYQPAIEPNVIPFIDVLLVLLIIFMVTAPKPTTDIRVDLSRPGLSATPPPIAPTMIEVHRGADSAFRVFVGARETPLAALGGEALAQILAANPALSVAGARADARVLIRADLDVAYAHVVAVMETLQQAGFAKVTMAAQRAD